MKVNLLTEFNSEKYNLNYKSHFYKSKTIHKLLKMPIKSIHKILNYINRYTGKCHDYL